MKVKCTECGDVIERPGPAEAVGDLDISHGVCDRCEAVYEARLEAEIDESRAQRILATYPSTSEVAYRIGHEIGELRCRLSAAEAALYMIANRIESRESMRDVARRCLAEIAPCRFVQDALFDAGIIRKKR